MSQSSNNVKDESDEVVTAKMERRDDDNSGVQNGNHAKVEVEDDADYDPDETKPTPLAKAQPAAPSETSFEASRS